MEEGLNGDGGSWFLDSSCVKFAQHLPKWLAATKQSHPSGKKRGKKGRKKKRRKTHSPEDGFLPQVRPEDLLLGEISI